MKLDFSELLPILNKEFGNLRGNVYYVRTEVPNSKIQILLQYYLDPLCIEEFEFVVLDVGVVIKSFKYNDKIGDGKMSHSYDIVFNDNSKPISIDNIKDIVVHLAI